MKRNIKSPAQFSEKLSQLFANMYDLFELTREEELPSIIDGCKLYDDNDKYYFHVSSQYERPADFFVSFLDFIRVMFEPNPLGTFSLNSNPGFIFNAIPRVPFRLGYVSAISLANEPIDQFFERAIAIQLKENNYSIDLASACFVMVSVNSKKYSFKNLGVEVLNFFNAGFSTEEALNSIKAIIEEQEFIRSGNTHVGFSIDNSLQDEMRLSMWIFL